MKLSLVIPCYNEAKSLPQLIQRLDATVLQDEDNEVILVNNGSLDNTQEVLAQLSHPRVRHVHVPINQGYGHGINEGLSHATGEILGWTHADLQTDPNDVLQAKAYFSTVSDAHRCYVKGKRYGRPWSDSFFTIGMAVFESCLLRRCLWDINAQPNLFHRDFYATLRDVPKDFSFDLYCYYQAKKQGLHIHRIPVRFSERQHGVSSWNTSVKNKYKFIRRTLSFSFALHRAK